MKSGLFLDHLDRATRPQDDLDGFVNGAWVTDNEIPADRARYGSFDALREQSEAAMRELILGVAATEAAPGSPEQQVGDLFTSFLDAAAVNAAGMGPLAEDVAAIDAVTDRTGVMSLLGRFGRRGIGGAFVAYSLADARNSSTNVLYVDQAGIGLPDESYYRLPEHAEVRVQYVAHIARMLQLTGLDPAQAEAIMDVETTLARSHWDRVACRDAVKTYNKLSRAELTDLTPGLDWDAWLQGMQARPEVLDPAVIEHPSYLAGFAAALGELPIDQWRSWLRWRLICSRAPYLPDAVVQESFDFFGATLSGVPQLRERWKRGVGLVEDLIGEAAGQLYVKEHFPPHAKARMEQLVAHLVEAYRRDFASLEWMSQQTRDKALEKLAKFTPKIGYPQQWKDYSDIEIRPDDLIGNVDRAATWEVDRMLRRVGEPVDREEWFMTPQTVNAYYMPVMNEIVFPAAILQPPFFDVEADDAVNYGGIGAVIGHEIGHGFDDQGSRFDGEGNLSDWWTAQDRERFDELAAALIAQFDDLEPRDAPGNKVNGSLTVGENIGDLGGLTIGFKAFQIAQEENPAPELDGFTPEQRFFIGWAQVWCGKAREAEARRLLTIDPHSPADQRANVARNLAEFHQAFGVQEGDGMYLPEEQRVRIF